MQTLEDTQIGADLERFRACPHTALALYRKFTPLVGLPGGVYLVTRHRDVAALIDNPDLRQMETELLTSRGVHEGELFRFFDNVMLTSNPPAHTNRRAPLAPHFAFKAVERFQDAVEAIADREAERAAKSGTFDLRDDYAARIPAAVVAAMLGIADRHVDEFSALAFQMARGLAPFPQEDFQSIEQACTDLYKFVSERFLEARKAHSDSILSQYLHSVEKGSLSDDEVLMQIVGIVLAGSDTTRFGITVLVGQLLNNAALWEELQEDPSLADAGVDEALRWEPPVGTIPRFPIEDMVIGGIEVPRGTFLAPSLLAAMRDRDVYDNPDRFDPYRRPKQRWHMAFGAGAHRCLGEAVARLQMREAVLALARRAPRLRLLNGPPKCVGFVGIRGVSSTLVVVKK